jgi:hypothetical protein
VNRCNKDSVCAFATGASGCLFMSSVLLLKPGEFVYIGIGETMANVQKLMSTR